MAAPKVRKVLHEFKTGTLHSGSAKGPKVTNRKQAIAIALSEARKAGQDVAAPKKTDKTEKKYPDSAFPPKGRKKKIGSGQSTGVGGFLGNLPPQSQTPMSLQGALSGGMQNPPMSAPPVMTPGQMPPIPPDLLGATPPPMPPMPAKKRAKPKKKPSASSAPKKKSSARSRKKPAAKPASSARSSAPKKKSSAPPWMKKQAP